MPLKDALFAVESLNRSFAMKNRSKEYTDILKGFFKVKKDSRWLAQIVFDDFRDHSLNILRLRGANRTQGEDTTAIFLLVSIVKLIVNCNHIIKHQGHYKKLLERGLDWEQGISKVSGMRILDCISAMSSGVCILNTSIFICVVDSPVCLARCELGRARTR